MCTCLILSCQDSDDDDDSAGAPPIVNPGPQSDLSISDVSQYTFWGEVMTITGTGFSTKKEDNIVTFQEVYQTAVPERRCNFSTDNGILIVEEATSTELKVRVPICSRYGKLEDGIDYCKSIKVQVNGKEAVYDIVVKFLGGPYYSRACGAPGSVPFSPGDTSYVTLDLEGMNIIDGITEAGYELSDIRIWLDGTPINYKLVEPEPAGDPHCGGLTMLYAMETPMSLAKKQCDDRRTVSMIVHIEGTSQYDTTDVQILVNPYQEIYSVNTTTNDANFRFSKGDDLQLNRGLIVKGRYMRTLEIAYVRGTDTVSVAESCNYCNEFEHTVPVSLLELGNYQVYFKDWCGAKTYAGLPVIQVVE